MSLPVFYTPRAKETLKLVYDFINIKFGTKAANKFLLKTDKAIDLISQQPFLFKASEFDKNIRVGLISKQTSLFYRIKDSELHLLFFWDNRQEPLIFR